MDLLRGQKASVRMKEMIEGRVHRTQDVIFKRVHTGSLIYNTCWEDPRLDREMLALQPDSRVVMITSAGCNALDYLLDDPAVIHAVDINPRQNALLQLKVALIENGDHGELRRVFGDGAHPDFRALLRQLSSRLDPDTYRYWAQKHRFFKSTRLTPSFYYRGAAGRVAWLMLQVPTRRDSPAEHLFARLMDAKSLGEQREVYERVKPIFWNALNSWLIRQSLTMAMLGVPRTQIGLIESGTARGLTDYIKNKVEHVLTSVPLQDNYFWRVYTTGRYTTQCCPNYLRPEFLHQLRSRVARVKTYDTTVVDFLLRNPGAYTHFVLLDHQDWLASHNTAALREEWDLILNNSRRGTRILMRSASPEINFIPAAVREKLKFFPELANRLHTRDRVGTYGCTLLAEVQ